MPSWPPGGAEPDGQLGQETVNALTSKPDQSPRAGHRPFGRVSLAPPLPRRGGSPPPGSPASISRSSVQRESGFDGPGTGLGFTPNTSVMQRAHARVEPAVSGSCGASRCLSAPASCWTERMLSDEVFISLESFALVRTLIPENTARIAGAYASFRRGMRSARCLHPQNGGGKPDLTRPSCPLLSGVERRIRAVDWPTSSSIPASHRRIPDTSSARCRSRSLRIGARNRRTSSSYTT